MPIVGPNTVRLPIGRRTTWLRVGWLLVVVGLLAAGSSAGASGQTTKRKLAKPTRPAVADYHSAHFLIHTDLPAPEAQDLLKRLETMLRLIATYWGRPPRGIIECYVAKDLSAWPPQLVQSLDPQGLEKIREGAGICVSNTLSSSTRFIAKAIVYASAEGGVAQHEAVHAYCVHTFGRTGPQWYAEGMAELGQHWIEGHKGVNADANAIRYLKQSPLRPLAQLIVADERMGGTWQDYAWWWSLCHLLEHNPNYSAQFRAMGMSFLTAKKLTFEAVFGPMARELAFEHRFFIEHLAAGYRVDLCAWDWAKKFRRMTTSGRVVAANVLAARGWQPSGLTVDPDVEYEYEATGRWKTEKDGKPVTADGGGPKGDGRLMGILMQEYRLSRPFALGSEGTFKFDVQGDLYLRCREDWSKLADNSGRIAVKFKVRRRAGRGIRSGGQETSDRG